MGGAEQPGFIGVAANELEIEVGALSLQEHGASPDRQLSDPAGAEATADHQAFGIAPVLEPQKAADNRGELLGKFFDGALHDAGSFRVTLNQERCQLFLADGLAGLLTERVVTEVFERLAPLVEKIPERSLAGLVADETFVVLDFDVVALDLDARQDGGTVRRKLGRLGILFGHGIPPTPTFSLTTTLGRQGSA